MDKKFKRTLFVVVSVIAIIIFLLLLRSCSPSKVDTQVVEKSQKVVVEENERDREKKKEIIQLLNFYDLLARADFCSPQWNKDAKSVVKELQALAIDKHESDPEMAIVIEQIASDLNNLANKNSLVNINSLEATLIEFENLNGGSSNE